MRQPVLLAFAMLRHDIPIAIVDVMANANPMYLRDMHQSLHAMLNSLVRCNGLCETNLSSNMLNLPGQTPPSKSSPPFAQSPAQSL